MATSKLDKNKLQMPVMFQKLNEYKTEDTRFTKVKIWIMHDGINYNWSYFSKEVIEQAIPTLANTPILGYIEPNSLGEDDFSDHRSEMTRDINGEYKYKYTGKAYGVIPQDNNAQFEYRLCDDGIERLYLTVEGLLWNKLNDSIDIMNRDVVKSQSMELHDDAEGYVDENNIFVFEKFRFYGACLLGRDRQSAMESSTIELVDVNAIQFTAEDYKKEKNKINEEINSKMEEFNKNFSIDERSVEKNMSKEKQEEIQVEETEVKDKVDFTQEEETKEVKEEEVKVDEKDFAKQSDDEEEEEDKSKSTDKDDEEDNEEDKKDKKNFEISESAYSELIEEVEVLRSQIAVFEKENKELKESLSTYQKAERELQEVELFSKYTELDGIEEYETLKSKVSEFEKLDDLEKEIALVFVRNKSKLSFTKSDEVQKENKISFDKKSDEDDGYGGLLNKYLNK